LAEKEEWMGGGEGTYFSFVKFFRDFMVLHAGSLLQRWCRVPEARHARGGGSFLDILLLYTFYRLFSISSLSHSSSNVSDLSIGEKRADQTHRCQPRSAPAGST
jgi:hypothetical protein